MRSAGFKGNQGSKAMGIGFMMEQAPTLLAGQECHVCVDISELRGGGTDRLSEDSQESDDDCLVLNFQGNKSMCGTAEDGKCFTLNAMHNTNYLVLNDQGGSVMDVSDKAGCLRAQEHGHPPVVCFEPGITKQEGGNSRIIKDRCSTLRAEMGDNQPAVCYAVYPGVSITSANSGSNPQPGDPCPTLVNDSRYYLVGVKEDDR